MIWGRRMFREKGGERPFVELFVNSVRKTVDRHRRHLKKKVRRRRRGGRVLVRPVTRR